MSDTGSRQERCKQWAKTNLPPALYSFLKFCFKKRPVHSSRHWARIVMNRETQRWVSELQPGRLKVLELSGTDWQGFAPFKDYSTIAYPDYDICGEPLPQIHDLIIAEQVFEHLARPYRAGRNVYQMLNPGGWFLVTTPFLVRVHDCPIDCTRWTETGMKYFLAECGFPPEKIKVASWGNRACVRASFNRWVTYRRWRHSLVNEPNFPVSVWALAQK